MAAPKASFGRTVVTLLAAGFVILLVIAGASIWLNQRNRDYTELVLLTNSIKINAALALGSLVDLETAQRGYLLTGEQRYLEPREKALEKLPAQMAELKRLTAGNAEVSARVATLESLNEARLGYISQSIDLYARGDHEAAIAVVRGGGGKAVMDQIRALVAEVEQIEDGLLRERANEQEGSANAVLGANLASLALLLGLGGISIAVVRNYIRELALARSDLEQLNTGLEETVRERTTEIVRANEEIQRFAYIVSHDLRAPLVNIMGFTSELEAIGKTFGQQQAAIAERAPELEIAEARDAVATDLPEAVDFIRASTSKMDRLINAILSLSREGQRTLKPVPVDLGELARSIAGSLKHQTTEAGAEIVVEDLPVLVTDRLAIEQIFSNLLENAVKYLEPDRAGRIAVSGAEDRRTVSIELADNGRGIDAKDQERVFELFRRAGRQDRPGEGLGLAFVRASVRRLGGAISLKSEPGRGTVFHLKFPKVLTIKGASRA